MILSFSRPEFKFLILSKNKIHTIRRDKSNRWNVGRTIHFWLGNPRNTRSKNKPHHFAVGIVSRVVEIEFRWLNEVLYAEGYAPYRCEYSGKFCEVYIDGKLCKTDRVVRLAKQDGFVNVDEFFKWFNEDFFGKIIYWDDLVPITI